MRAVACTAARAACTLATGALAVGCGDSARAPAADAIGTEPVVADPAGRLVVARVDGVPVYGDCVANQAAAHGLTREQALAECIDFELLAIEAAARGLAAHPEVREARRKESVRRLIDRAFRDDFGTPETTDQARLRAAYQRFDRRYHRPEFRFTEYVRVPALETVAPPGSAADREARALADAIYARVEGRRDVTALQLRAIAVEEAAGRKLQYSGKPFDFPRHGRAVEPYAAATWALPEPGMVSPPTRTKWGWDLILLTKILPEKDISFEQARPELFELVRRDAFHEWTTALAREAEIEVDEAALARLEDSEELAVPGDEPASRPGQTADDPAGTGAEPR